MMKTKFRILINVFIVGAMLVPMAVVAEANRSLDAGNDGILPAEANDIYHSMVTIPAGEFQMGCDPDHNNGYDCNADQVPLHTVDLDTYSIDKYEVANFQYAAFLNERGSNACNGAECVQLNYPGHIYLDNDEYAVYVDYEDHPVIHVNWEGAAAYCAENGKRLPTEAEWEKAARGTTVQAYPWGDPTSGLYCSQANHYLLYSPYGCVGDTKAVGQLLDGASPYGVQDMAGNAREWVSDWYGYDYYSSSPSSNPTGPDSGTDKVLRGGSWATGEQYLLTATRGASSPHVNYNDTGFRCAVDGSVPAPANHVFLPDMVKNIHRIEPGKMIAIPAGEFQMGCHPDHTSGFDCSSQLLLHAVNLDAYLMDQYEVTNAQYAAFLNQRGSNVCNGVECLDLGSYNLYEHIYLDGSEYVVESGYENNAVIEVTWYGANAYCAENGKRLPTEAEWEKAARGTTPRAYPWGDTLPTSDALANFSHFVFDVGRYPRGASPYGLMDMAGNALEWVSDWYALDYYSSSPYNNPTGPDSGTDKVLRGGSAYIDYWENPFFKFLTSSRYHSLPSTYIPFSGFRCAADTP